MRCQNSAQSFPDSLGESVDGCNSNRPETPSMDDQLSEPFFTRISHCLMELVKSPALGGKAKGYYETIGHGSGCSGRPGWARLLCESAKDRAGATRRTCD